MLNASKEETDSVVAYYLSQSPAARVDFLQKVYSEAIIGHVHDVWDVHASNGRWWVITNPTNLYSQEQFPNMDLAVTFHVGLCLRIPRTQQQLEAAPSSGVRLFAPVLESLDNNSEALRSARNVEDYRAVGMRCRETLLSFIVAAQDAAEWLTEGKPKRADFRAWSEVLCSAVLSGEGQKERRHLFKTLLNEAWTFSNWLTHSQSSTWHDAEAVVETTEHAIGLLTSLLLRFVRFAPEACPKCGSPELAPEEGWRQDMPEIVWERPICNDCGWTGLAVPVSQRDPQKDEDIITRTGHDYSEHVLPTVPLTMLIRPSES